MPIIKFIMLPAIYKKAVISALNSTYSYYKKNKLYKQKDEKYENNKQTKKWIKFNFY